MLDSKTLWCAGLTGLEQGKYGWNGCVSIKEIVFNMMQRLRI